MTGDPSVCTSYALGHRVHFIQARKAAADAGVFAELLGVEDGVVTLSTEKGVRVYRHHNTARLAGLLRADPQTVRLVARWGVVRVGGGSWRTLLSLAPAEHNLTACRSPA